MTEVLKVSTPQHTCAVNVTQQVREVVRNSGVIEGICIVYVPHTTASVFINEGADPDVVRDILYALEKVVPWNDPKYEHAEGNSAAHIRSSVIGNSRIIPVVKGDLMLGTWESIFLAEFDGPRNRKLVVKVIGED